MKTPTLTRRHAPPREHVAATKNAIARATGGLAEGGLRVDFKRLDAPAQRELIELSRSAADGGGFNVDRLGPRAKRWEELVERGADADGIFERTRADLSLRARAQELVRRARKPVRRPRWEEDGAVVLPQETVFDWLNRPAPILHLTHLGILVFVLGQLETRLLCPRAEGSRGAATRRR